jgi:hypothetical protein
MNGNFLQEATERTERGGELRDCRQLTTGSRSSGLTAEYAKYAEREGTFKTLIRANLH